MTIIPDIDAHILGLCFHGKTGIVDKKLQPAWLQSPISAKLVSACITLHHEGKPVNAVAAISKAKLNVTGLVGEVIKIWQDGFGQADPQDAIDHSYQLYVNSRATQIADEIKQLAQSDPQNVKRWLAREVGSFESLIRDGESYDPRPSVLANRPMPVLFAHSLITEMDPILRGGYYSGWLYLIAGLTKQGKSTSLRSHALDLALQKFKVVMVLTEGDEGIASAQLAAALTGIDFMKEIAQNKFLATDRESPQERKARYQRALEYFNEYVLVYPSSYCSDTRLSQLVHWQHPNALIIDYLKDGPNLFERRTFPSDNVGHFADYLLDLAHSQGVWIGSAGQISADSTNKNMRKDRGELVILYGSSRVGQAADEFIFQKRHNFKPNFAYIRVMLDRYFAKQDTKHELTPIDVTRRILEIRQLVNHDWGLA